MRMKITQSKRHEDFASALVWSSNVEVLSCGDDHKFLQWNSSGGNCVELATLPDTLHPTDMHWCPNISIGSSKKGAQGSDIFALASMEGKFYLISKNGRVEKSVEGHRGAILCVRWNQDGTALITTGEDGVVKLWSRGGMLRLTLAQGPSAVHSAAWSPDSASAVFSCGQNLVVKSTQQVGLSKTITKENQWKAHDGIILCIDWNATNHSILSGGEDRKFRIWDNYGRNLYVSKIHDYPITSVAWSPNGQNFAVGSFNSIRLCDEGGWTNCLNRIEAGSILNIVWSPDGTKLAGATAAGHVIFGYIIERRIEWKNYVVCQTSENSVEICDTTNEAVIEKLEMRDNILNLSISWDHLIVISTNQCLIYSVKNWNTPTIVEMQDSAVSLILQAPTCFMLTHSNDMQIWSYKGRPLASPKLGGLNRWDLLTNRTVALSSDTLVICDCQNWKNMHVVDVDSGKLVKDGFWVQPHEIKQIAVDQNGPTIDRKIAILDKNGDLFLRPARPPSAAPSSSVQIGSMIDSIAFNDVTNMLCGFQDNFALVWIYPAVAFIDKNIMPKTIIRKAVSENGQRLILKSFLANQIIVRRQDGTVNSVEIAPFSCALLNFLEKNKWDESVKLARRIKDESLWAALAVAAIYAKNFPVAEIAYASLNEVEKLHMLDQIRSLNNKNVRNSEVALFCGDENLAESTLLQSGHIFRAIIINLEAFHWDRALDLAQRHNAHVDIVCGCRQKYLEKINQKEDNKKFSKLNFETEVDWETIQEKIDEEYAKEK